MNTSARCYRILIDWPKTNIGPKQNSATFKLKDAIYKKHRTFDKIQRSLQLLMSEQTYFSHKSERLGVTYLTGSKILRKYYAFCEGHEFST